MSALAPTPAAPAVPALAEVTLGAEVLAHLEAQLQSARRLLAVVLRQGAAIRARAVQEVVSCTGLMQAELGARQLIERERARLLAQAGVRLGVDSGRVTLEALCELMDPVAAATALAQSAELRGLLEEVRREHHTNHALMRQELCFLDHLLRLVDSDRVLGYDSGGDHARTTARRASAHHRVLDLEV